MPIRVERQGNRIVADVPWDSGAGALEAKAVPGARPKYKDDKFCHWTYPLDMTVCRALRSQFGDRLRIGPALAAWAKEEVAREAAQTELRAATDADLSVVPRAAPVLAAALDNRPYQKVGVKFAVDGGSVLIADEPGMGKTLETLGAIVESGATRVLIFAKKKAASTVWAPEIERWLGDLADVWVATGDLTKEQREAEIQDFFDTQMGDKSDKIYFLICNIEMVRWTGLKAGGDGKSKPTPSFPQMFLPKWHAVVVDESHKSLIGRHTMSKSITQTRYGMMKLKLRPDALKIALSGTPSRGHLRNLWGTLNWLRPKVFTGYGRWIETFFDYEDNSFGGRDVGGLREDKHAEFDAALSPIMLRRTKAEVAPELPRKLYGGSPLDPRDPETTIGIWGEMSKAQHKAYDTIKADGILKFDNGQRMNVNGVLAELTRRKQYATCTWKADENNKLHPVKGSSWKFDWIMEKEEELEGKMVVFSQFTALLNAFHRWANDSGVESLIITGESKALDVAEAVVRFNEPTDSARIIFVNTIAGGESINLDRCADTAVFIDETFIPDDQEQAEDRIHRMSRIHQVVIYYLRSLDSIEESVCRITGARDACVKARLDGSRGKIFARLLKEE